MKAAVVRELGRSPSYGEFEEPSPRTGETLISVSASAVSRLVRGRSSGAHYSADDAPPFVPGIDGIGRTDRGRHVYFAFPRSPFGALAERCVVSDARIMDAPDGPDDASLAAAANPGMSCWIPLTRLAPVRPDEAVLINGATGTAGQMAVQVARYLGAPSVIATARDEAKLERLGELGADVRIPLQPPMDAFRETVRKVAREKNVGTVLDYLWGPSTEAILEALGGPNAPRGPSRVRFVEVGGVAGPTIALSGAVLRSSGVELLGTGLGSSSNVDLFRGIGEFLQAFAKARFRIAVDVHPLSEIDRAWDSADPAKRLVFTVP